MCGLFAYYSTSTPLPQARVRDAITALKPRGPDGDGFWTDWQGRVVLAHTRLSVMAPLAGAQPIVNESADVAAVVTGEFYGFERIRDRLKRSGHVFSTRSDSEIVVHLYEELGAACLEHLRGEFALVLWDRKRGRILAARDRFGVKPLVYAVHGGAVYLASDAKTLFAAGVAPRWDPAGVRALLLSYLPPDGSIFGGVRQVAPGTWIEIDENAVRTGTYWDLDYPRRADALLADPADAVERFQGAFDEAVALRLRSDVPVSCMLSGGVDSAAVLASCTPGEEPPPAAFTLSFEDEHFDEAPGARAVARHLQAPWTRISASQQDLVDHLSDAVRAGEMPGINGHAVGRFLLARSISRASYRVALAGDGADDVLAGYVHAVLDDAQACGQPGQAVPELLHGVQNELGFVPSWISMSAVARSPFYALLDARAIGPSDTNPYVDLVRACSAGGGLRERHRLHQSLYLWCKTILPNYALVGERLEMANGLEVRLPFLDHHLFDVVRTLPINLLVKDGEQKRVLRRSLDGRLPPHMRERSKRPFASQLAVAREGSLLVTLVRDLLGGGFLPPFLDRVAVGRLLDLLPRLDTGRLSKFDPIVHMLAGLCFLQMHFNPRL